MATVKQKLTDRLITSIKPPEAGQDDYFDVPAWGFSLRVGKSGSKTFSLHYRHGGKVKRLKLGRYPALSLAQAREMAQEALQEVAKGNDPQNLKRERQAAQAQRITFGELVEQFKTRYIERNLKPSTRGDYIGYLDREFLPIWKDRPADGVMKEDILKVLKEMADRKKNVRGPDYARAIIRKLFKWATDNCLIKVFPAADIPRQGKIVKRKRRLRDDEIKKFWQATEKLGYPFGPFFQILLLTGQRESEVAAMNKKRIVEGVWYIGENKSNRENEIPLSTLTQEILKNLPDNKNDLVFTTTGETPVSGFARAKKKLDELAEIEEPWRIHDLRRTARTYWAKLGVPRVVSELILNHSLKGLDEVYDQHDYTDEKRQGLNKWAQYVERITQEEPAKVIVLRA